MASAATPASIESHVSEVLEVAQSILRRHHDDDLSEKMSLMQECLALQKKRPELDCRDLLSGALADLTCAVHRHLNTEVEAIASIFGRLSDMSEGQNKH
jgi:hypothetical protein